MLEHEDGWQVNLIVVSQYREILETAAGLGAEAVYNGGAKEGIASSLRLGTLAAPEDTDFSSTAWRTSQGLRPPP